MDVVLAIGVGVVLAVVGHPADGTPSEGAAAEGGRGVFEPPGRMAKLRVGEESVVGQADSQAGGHPVEEDADGQGLPGRNSRGPLRGGR